MGVSTKIEWADSTLNLEIGCAGCELWNPKVGEKTCYAGQLVERYGGTSKGFPESFDKPKLFPERLAEAERWPDLRGKDRPDKPWLNGLPRTIFLDDMGDTFTESLPIDWLAPYLERLSKMPVIVQLLTKRANRMLEFSKTHKFPENFWLMTSVTSAANYNRVEQLLEVRGGSCYGISYEPAWGPISLAPYLRFGQCGGGHRTRDTKITWVISGGSSGATAKPSHPDWFRDVRDECQRAGCAYFHKQNGEWISLTPARTVSQFKFDDGLLMHRVGKKKAGRLLDGCEWNEIPQTNLLTSATTIE